MNYYDDLEKGYDKSILISNLVRNALVDKQLCELARMFMRDHISIYILRLTNNKFYVGKTYNIFIRYKQHLNGNGSFWTKKYKPLYNFTGTTSNPKKYIGGYEYKVLFNFINIISLHEEHGKEFKVNEIIDIWKCRT